MLEGLRAEGVEPTLVLWSVSKAVRDLWAAVHVAPGGQARSAGARQSRRARCRASGGRRQLLVPRA